MTDENFEKDIAEAVIRPKLQKVCKTLGPIQNKAELRKKFIEQEGVSMSAAKFEAYLAMLNITFEKKVEIKGLYPDAPPPAAAGADASEEEDFKFDNEATPPHIPVMTRGGFNPRDMFGQG